MLEVPRLIRLLGPIGDLLRNVVYSGDGCARRCIGGRGPAVSAPPRSRGKRIDKTTVTELNIPLGFRIRQPELALERWRRRPYDPSCDRPKRA